MCAGLVLNLVLFKDEPKEIDTPCKSQPPKNDTLFNGKTNTIKFFPNTVRNSSVLIDALFLAGHLRIRT